MRVSIIGAGGFVGQRLAALCAQDSAVSDLVLSDVVPFSAPAKSTHIAGSFADPDIAAQICDGADCVVLLASVLGGAAESNYGFARQINVNATLDLFERLKTQNPKTRMVFASSIAVFAKPLPEPVTDTTPTGPTMVYGAQKLMMEVALSNFAAKGWLDGVSLRLSGVMARDGADAALKSAFMSRLFWCVKRGEDIVLPVSKNACTWLTSVNQVSQNFLHAIKLLELGSNRAITLPALALTYGQLVEALQRKFPQSPSKISFEPDAEIMSLFGSYPQLTTPIADELGFCRDENVDALVKNSLCEG